MLSVALNRVKYVSEVLNSSCFDRSSAWDCIGVSQHSIVSVCAFDI